MLGFAASASAAVDPFNIDPEKKGSITLTKYSTPENERTSVQGDGKQNPTAPTPNSVPLAGAEFEIHKVNHASLDLTTNAGWSYLEDLIAGVGPHPAQDVLDGTAGVSLTSQGSKITGADGVLKWTELPLGLYYVTETTVPAGHKASSPFFVTIPMTDPVARDKWMYDVFVYPKNIENDTVKIPQDKDVHVPGDQLPWEVRTTIPGTPATPVTILRIEDVLDAALDYSSVQMQIGDVWGGSTNLALTASDFTATYDAATRKVTASLTAAGIAKANSNQGKTLLVHINTVVNANYKGVVNNEATVITNTPGSTTETEQITTPSTTSKYGKFTVNKTDSDGKPLTGAKFNVYYSHSKTPDFTKESDPVAGIALTGVVCDMTVGNATSCSDELRYSDWAEGEQLLASDARYNYYWLVETQAPNGFELLADPIGFEITGANAPSFELPAITVENVKRGGGLILPFTGGAGSIAFVIAGVALLVGGSALVVVRGRRKAAESEISA